MSAPTDWRTGKLCYLELPAADVDASADFYRRVFGWTIDRRGDGALAFTDTVGGVSGVFVTDRQPADDPHILVYVMVADAEAAVTSIAASGGRLVRWTPPEAAETFAWFADPAGNVLGIYQQPGLSEIERVEPTP
jgi:predicted enzyme related to lactoylglutathione lyase